MTTIIKREEFRNDGDDATIIIEQYVDKGSVPLWRYFVKYDSYMFTGRCSAGLWTKPSKKRLRERY